MWAVYSDGQILAREIVRVLETGADISPKSGLLWLTPTFLHGVAFDF